MKQTELEKRIAKTMKRAGWKPSSFKRRDGTWRFVVCVPSLNHEQKSIVVDIEVKDSSACECSSSIGDDELRIWGDERPRAEEIVRQINEECKPLISFRCVNPSRCAVSILL